MRPEVIAGHVAETIRGVVAPIASRVADLEALTRHTAGLRELGALGDRVAALESRAPVPGPTGPPGPPGPPGRDGSDGKDGAPGLRYLGVHEAGKGYDVGDLVTAGGSAWYCARTTTGTPGHSPDWTLMVKRGRDRSARP